MKKKNLKVSKYTDLVKIVIKNGAHGANGQLMDVNHYVVHREIIGIELVMVMVNLVKPDIYTCK
jgi:hypothetical protein